MSFLYENYKDDAWYWELVEVVRKLILTCGIILIGRESRAYVGLASICSGLFAIFYAFRKPIRDEFEDKLQLTSLLVIFLNLGIGVILKIPKESVPSDVDQYVDSLLVNILVVGANVLVIVLVVGMSINLLTSFISTTKAYVRVVYKNSLVYQQFIGFSIFIHSFIHLFFRSFFPILIHLQSLAQLHNEHHPWLLTQKSFYNQCWDPRSKSGQKVNELIDCLHSVYKVFFSMKEYWFMNSKLQFELHLQFTAVILLFSKVMDLLF